MTLSIVFCSRIVDDIADEAIAVKGSGKMQVNGRESASRSEVIQYELEKRILIGKYKEEEKFPTQVELCSEFQAGPGTISLVLQLMACKGLIYKRINYGYYLKSGAVNLLKESNLKKLNSQVDNLAKFAMEIGISAEDLMEIITSRFNQYWN